MIVHTYLFRVFIAAAVLFSVATFGFLLQAQAPLKFGVLPLVIAGFALLILEGRVQRTHRQRWETLLARVSAGGGKVAFWLPTEVVVVQQTHLEAALVNVWHRQFKTLPKRYDVPLQDGGTLAFHVFGETTVVRWRMNASHFQVIVPTQEVFEELEKLLR